MMVVAVEMTEFETTWECNSMGRVMCMVARSALQKQYNHTSCVKYSTRTTLHQTWL